MPEYFTKRQIIKEVTHKTQLAIKFAKIMDTENENNTMMCFGDSHKGQHYQPDLTLTNK